MFLEIYAKVKKKLTHNPQMRQKDRIEIDFAMK